MSKATEQTAKYAEISKKLSHQCVYSPEGRYLRYRLFAPETGANAAQYPLVVFLHGIGERGTDNEAQVTKTCGAFVWATDEIQRETPCFIACPQCPSELSWTHEGIPELVMAMVDQLCERYPIDRMRLYLCGLSMGGIGTWNLIAKYPGVFAAAMPICGATTPANAAKVGSTPLWAFHAADDEVVPAAGEMHSRSDKNAPPIYGSRLAVSEAVRCGARNVKYTEYPAGYISGKYGFAHAAWLETFDDPEARKWMFAQSRLDIYDIKSLTPGVWEISDSLNDSMYVVEGAQRALVIDTGMARGDIIQLVSSITCKPFELALTHGHGDHSMHCARFERIYLDFADKAMLFEDRFPGQSMPDENRLVDIGSGHHFDLGGGVVIKTVALPGHTPGSLLFVDEKHRCVFTGDAVGSGCGVWMQVPTASPLSEYAASLRTAAEVLTKLGVEDGLWAFLGGHAAQRFMSTVMGYNPISLNMFEDMAKLCDKLISGEVTPVKEGVDERAGRFGDVYFAKYGSAEMMIRKDLIR